MESFLARRSNHDPMDVVDRLLTADRLENVLDFCNILISIFRAPLRLLGLLVSYTLLDTDVFPVFLLLGLTQGDNASSAPRLDPCSSDSVVFISSNTTAFGRV